MHFDQQQVDARLPNFYQRDHAAFHVQGLVAVEQPVAGVEGHELKVYCKISPTNSSICPPVIAPR